MPRQSRRAQFKPETFLERIAESKKILDYSQGAKIFTQSNASDAVYYIQKGRLKLTVVSEQGKEAIVAILGVGDFLGEECLAGQPLRLATAAALSDCSLLKIEKKAMQRALQQHSELSTLFTAHLLSRSIRYQADLVDQLFNSSEKRLARILLLMAHFGKDGPPHTEIPDVSQETLAQMVGTTRARINHFMNKFRKLGLIKYNDGRSTTPFSTSFSTTDPPQRMSAGRFRVADS